MDPLPSARSAAISAVFAESVERTERGDGMFAVLPTPPRPALALGASTCSNNRCGVGSPVR